jgi:hypothetical protein
MLDVDIALSRSEDLTFDDKAFNWPMGHPELLDLDMGRDNAGVSFRVSMKIFLQPSESRENDMVVKSSYTFVLVWVFSFCGIVYSVAAMRPFFKAGQLST